MQSRPPTRSSPSLRRAAAVLEGAIILPVLLLLLLTLLDLGLAVARQNSLTDCASRAARLAIVCGASSEQPLGPTAWTGALADTHALTDHIRPHAVCLPPAAVAVQALWPDGDHRPGDRVVVSLEYLHTSLLLDAFGAWRLSARSTMRIVH